MKRLLILIAFVLLFVGSVAAQVSSQNAKRIYSGTALPTWPCSPGPSYTDYYLRTSTSILYYCSAANTWSVFASAGGGAAWGAITGTLSNQTDLQTALNAKLSLAGGTMTGNLLFTDNTLDIGASGATRPRTGYFGTSVVTPLLTSTGPITQTSASATAFESGPNGGTNPVFRLVNSTASSATGLSITGNASGSGVTIRALGGTNENIILIPKGTGGFSVPGASTGSERFGAGTIADFDGTAVGNGASTGTSSGGTAIGRLALARQYTVSVGYNANSDASGTGSGSVAIGLNTVAGGDSIAIGHNASSLDGQIVFSTGTSALTDVYFGSNTGKVSGTPAATTLLHGLSGTGSNIAGSNWIMAGGISTGTGKGGDTGFQTSPSGATGSTANSLIDRLRTVAKGVVLTSGVATSIFELALPTLTGAGGSIDVVIVGFATLLLKSLLRIIA